MNSFSNELHLLLTIALHALMWGSAYKFARIFRDRLGAANDALLLGFAIEYLSITLPGIAGKLSVFTISLAVIALSGAMILTVLKRRQYPDIKSPASNPDLASRAQLAITVFSTTLVISYLGILLYNQSTVPPLGDDGMIYHLPSAIQWLKSGTIGIYHTWFVNPANTFSPLGGSTFIAFLVGPMGNDVAARNCQIPALLLIYFAMIDLLRALGIRTGTASIFAAAAVLCRPFLSQTMLVKDDLYLAAFFMTFVAGCARDRIGDKFGPWRLAISLGLLLSIKYTALMALPVLLLLVDAPFRAGWKFRHWVIFVVTACALFLPWFLRNWIICSNPLFPIPIRIAGHTLFPGLFSIARSTEMAGMRGVWEAFTQKYHEISPISLVLLAIGWLVAAVMHFRSMRGDPLLRMCIFGALLGMLIFVFTSHAAEIRYTYTSILLCFAAAALIGRGTVLIAVALLVTSLATTYNLHDLVAIFAAISIGTALLITGISPLLIRHGRFARIALATILLLAGSVWIYINYSAFLLQSDRNAGPFWATRYGAQGELWKRTRSALPIDARIAVANTVLPYPLLGNSFQRTVEYFPTRAGVKSYLDLPQTTLKLTDQQIRPWVAAELSKDPDWGEWLIQLRLREIQYLYVERQVANPNPIELDFATSYPEFLEKLFENEAGAVFKLPPIKPKNHVR